MEGSVSAMAITVLPTAQSAGVDREDVTNRGAGHFHTAGLIGHRSSAIVGRLERFPAQARLKEIETVQPTAA
jgi:hypothetical protein